MSDTDKTKPLWVKLNQNPRWRVEVHDHRKGECDLPNEVTKYYVRPRFSWIAKGRICGYWTSREGAQVVWGRRSNAEQAYRAEANGKARRQIRHLKREIMKMSREDIENCEFLSFPHRHQALWDVD